MSVELRGSVRLLHAPGIVEGEGKGEKVVDRRQRGKGRIIIWMLYVDYRDIGSLFLMWENTEAH